MNNSSTGEQLLFLLGAGFNVDAASEARNPRALSSGRPAKYPLVSELIKSCFGMDAVPPDKSIEDLFQDSIDKDKRGSLKTLYDMLMEADYYISPCLKKGKSNQDNVYTKFLKAFPKAPLLTFNYDSLPEILLLAEAACRKILVVAPNADNMVKRLSKDHPCIQWKASSWSFRDWVNNDYPGIT